MRIHFSHRSFSSVSRSLFTFVFFTNEIVFFSEINDTNNIFTSVVKFEKGNQLPLVAVVFSTINFIGLEKESPIKTDITKARINRSSIPFARMIR